MKRFISMLVTICLVFGMVHSSGASNNFVVDAASIETEISKTMDELMYEVGRQLKEQDALDHLSIYYDVLYPQVSSSIYSKYGVTPETAAPTGYEDDVFDPPNLHLPYGGIVSYRLNGNKITVTCLSRYKTLLYVTNHSYNTSLFSTILNSIFAFLETPLSLVSALVEGSVVITDAQAISKINAANGHAMFISTETTDSATTVVLGWDTYNYYQVPANATNWLGQIFDPYPQELD